MREQHGPIKEQQGFVGGAQDRRSFGNYDLVRRIDVGGMGEVYLAHQRSAFGREVAVKIIRSDLVHDTTARKRFLREAEVSSHLKHEHILPLFEFGEEQGRLFLVTPYIQGGTLGHRLQSGPLPLADTHQLFSALVRAVSYVHKRGVVHRDLKPNNVLLDKGDGADQVYVRLIDFGIASLPGLVGGTAALTEAGHEMGTIAYMAPERLDGIAAPSNDIYSLGVILYQMLTGQLPDPNRNQKLTLPQALNDIVTRCMAIDPANRFTTADDLLSAFEYAYRAVRSAPQPQLQPQPPAPLPVKPVPPPVRPPSLPDADVLSKDEPTPKRITQPRPAVSRPASQPAARTTTGNTGKHNVLPRSEVVLKPLSTSGSGSNFTRSDYDAPTSFIGPASRQGQPQAQRVESVATIAKPPTQAGQKRKISTAMLISLSIVIIVVVIAGIAFAASSTLITAKITVSPLIHQVSNTFTLNTNANLQGIDPGTSSLPISTQTTTKTISKTGPATGKQLSCVFLGIDCGTKVVSDNDINQLTQQIKQDPQVTQDLKSQLQAKNAVLVGQPTTKTVDGTANPPVDAKSDTVTVSLTIQASVQYILNKDMQDLTRALLLQQAQRQFGSNYQLIDQMTQFSAPQVQTGSNPIKVLIAVGGLAEYHISANQLSTLKSLIKGKSTQDARTILAKQLGIDPNASNINISYGGTLPGDVNQITITAVNPINLPQVQVPSLPASTNTGG